MSARASALMVLASLLSAPLPSPAQPGVVQNIAPDVYFHEGDNSRGHCNNGWVVMDDEVVAVDANYPSGAAIVIPKIRAMTAKPIRFVIDTHFHPDHSFGNQLWADAGAVVVAQIATLEELQRSGAAAWALAARTRPDVAATKLKLPDLVYTDQLVFTDAHHRIELLWLGPAHTHGDSLVWLPREKILFTGDVCVNGAYNYLHDSDVTGWIKVLDKARALGPGIVCPGHGPIGGPELLTDQRDYFVGLMRAVQVLIDAKKSPAEIRAAVPGIGAELRAVGHIARYVPTDFWLTAQVEKIDAELTGTPLAP